ncbi:unnamed protein product [Cunninghamella blakesleeana]
MNLFILCCCCSTKSGRDSSTRVGISCELIQQELLLGLKNLTLSPRAYETQNNSFASLSELGFLRNTCFTIRKRFNKSSSVSISSACG